jgi:hypothetical protein
MVYKLLKRLHECCEKQGGNPIKTEKHLAFFKNLNVVGTTET